MPHYAWVQADLTCPRCGAVIADLLWLPWGGMMASDPGYGPTYRVGSRILWFVDRQGNAPPDAIWRNSNNVNVGDPRLLNVDVFTERVPDRCAECGQRIQSGRVVIRDGVIMSTGTVKLGEVDSDVIAMVMDGDTDEVLNEIRDAPLHESD